MPEIPAEAAFDAAVVIQSHFGSQHQCACGFRYDGADEHEIHRASLALTAALPHLRVQGTAPTEEELGFVEVALQAVDGGNAGHWPTVAGYLADEVRRLRATPAPRPVVDREGVLRLISDFTREDEAFTSYHAGNLTDQILALLPTEEDTKGEGS